MRFLPAGAAGDERFWSLVRISFAAARHSLSGPPYRSWRRLAGRYAPHRQVDAAALGQQGGSAGQNPLDPVKCEPRLPAEHQDIAEFEFHGPRRVGAAQAPDPEHAAIAERNGEHRGREILLIAV